MFAYPREIQRKPPYFRPPETARRVLSFLESQVPQSSLMLFLVALLLLLIVAANSEPNNYTKSLHVDPTAAATVRTSPEHSNAMALRLQLKIKSSGLNGFKLKRELARSYPQTSCGAEGAVISQGYLKLELETHAAYWLKLSEE